jgi:hypothetical protein
MTAGDRERSPEWFIPAGPHRNIPGRREYSPAPSGLFAAGGNIPNRALGYPQPAGIFPAFGGGTPGWRGGIPGNVGDIPSTHNAVDTTLPDDMPER